MTEIVFHGVGGQGAVTASDILALAAGFEGKFSQSFPYYGVERRGAPVTSYCRIDEKPIRIHMRVYRPDIAVVLEPNLLDRTDVTSGLKGDKIVIINSTRNRKLNNAKIYYVDASGIAMEHLGKNIVNTAMLGALSKATNLISIGSLRKAIIKRFGNDGLSRKNIESAKECYEQLKEAT
jgi:2-oxoacid:acceptor oxidoreductase gamma subunit (pyruvate/2-ketoisovalerate family)